MSSQINRLLILLRNNASVFQPGMKTQSRKGELIEFKGKFWRVREALNNPSRESIQGSVEHHSPINCSTQYVEAYQIDVILYLEEVSFKPSNALSWLEDM